ncbi:MAG: helix-turn-helix transcriptional regulator [Emergencia timonensis]|uniref:helix-turn-helix transcriptional regulator n=1 Tax=Emergencia timonensis TaxID=1776384 RepID=UPI000833FCED|nr:AraC family transcriptional regulator [Emergencia timonensis]WNX87402.1 AraC family transcriptional regulator [Emergencia timonensis]
MPNKQIRNIASVIAYIEAHLTQKLNLDILAEAMHYSKYHLHRIFTDTVGLTIHDYIQRRRLSEAAKLLIFSEKSVLDIALLAGYESQQAFTDAFTRMYKLPPAKYRENEEFYPLQLRFEFEGNYRMLNEKKEVRYDICFAAEEDIPCWMELVKLVVDGFPNLQEETYRQVLREKIKVKEALILKDEETAIGIMLFTSETGSIDFMACHPLYKKKGIPKAFLDKVLNELVTGKNLTITTYREGDKADTGQRQEIKKLGFAEAELLVEFGYPTQRFVLQKGGQKDGQ